MAHNNNFSLDIPEIDLSKQDHPLTAGCPQARALREGFTDCGMVKVRNHGIAPDLFNQAIDLFLQLTRRPLSEKYSYCGKSCKYQRGWIPASMHRGGRTDVMPDLKEAWQFCAADLDQRAAIAYPDLHAPNIWPKGEAVFQQTMLQLGRELHSVALRVLTLCEIIPGLSSGELRQYTEGAPHVTRAIRYLSVPREYSCDDVLWSGEHTDMNLITILPTAAFYHESALTEAPDDGAGLYCRSRDGLLRQCSVAPSEMLIQVGEELEILTGGTFRAAPHLVRPSKRRDYGRISFAHFVHLNSMAAVFPLRDFADPISALAYGPSLLAGDYATMHIDRWQKAVGLS